MNIWSVLFISVIYFYTRTAGLVPQKIPESLKCVDPECSVPISEANPALKQYNTFNLSLRKNQKVIIYGKGSKTYYVEVDGKRGYIPKSVVMEKIVFVKDADLKYVGTPGTKAMDKIASESQVKVNVKSTPETKVEPTVDIGSLKPEMPPIMQGAFLLAGAAADDSGMTSSPKIPDAIPDAVPDTAKNAADAAKNTADAAKNTADATKNAADAAKNAADSAKNAAYASPPEDVKSSSDAPAGVNDAVEDEADPTTAGLSKDEADVLGVDAGLDDNAVTDTTGSAQNEPVESGTKVEASVDTTFESTKETTVDSSGNIAAIESSNDSTVESISTSDLTSNDTTPQLISKVDNITDYIIKDPNASEKDSVEKIPDEPKIKEAAVENGGVFGFLGLAGETKDVKKDEGEEAPKEVVDENAGDSSAEDVNLTENKGVKLPVGIVIDVGIERNIVETKLDESAKNLTEEDKKSDKIEELSKNLTEKDKKSDKIEETQTEKIVVVEKDIVETKLGESAKNLTKEDKKFDRIEETQTEKVAEFYEKVEQKDVKVDSIVSNEIGAENATEGQPAFVGGLQEGKIADDGVKSETEEKKDSERAGRVKRDFMYQPNQYAYNSYPNHQQQRNYGGRVNEYNNNNYRQYQQPNAYAYQPHANFEGNTHHPNMEANVHHQNMYHNTQLPPKVEITTARTSEPDVPVPSTQVPTNTALPPVTSEPDYEDVSVEVDDSSGEVTTAPQKEEATVSPTQETTSAETETITDKPEVEVVHEEEQPVESTESPQEQEEQSVVSPEESTESEGSWFKAITDLFASGKTDDVEVDSKSHEESPASIVPSNEEEPKLTDEKCSADDVSCELDKLEAKLSDGELLSTGPLISESDDLLGALLDSLQKTSSGPIFCLIVTACAVVGFSLGYNFIENRKREGELVAKINSLEKQNLVEKKEKIQLKDKLQHVCQTSTLNNEAEASYLSQIAALAEERNALIAEKRELEDQLVEVERELQTATESNLEMNNLLSESLSTPDGSTALLETVETLKAKLENQNKEVKELNRLLNEKSEEIDSIRKELKANQEAKKLLQEKLTVLKREKDEEFLQLKESNRDLSTQLDDLMETKSLENLKLSNELSKLQITLTETQTMLGDRNGEIDALRHVISRLKTNLKEDELNNLYDVASMTGKLTQAESERDNYKEKFLEEEGARKLLEGHVQVISQEVASLKQNYEAAEKEKIEALTKVQVLSNYFKEKETQLQKELGLKESMWLQKQSDDNTIYEQMKSLREENERYKNDQSQLHSTTQLNIQHQNQPPLQNGVLGVTKKKKKKVKGNPGPSQPTSGSQLESLKKEISESETDYKSQIAKAEQKSYENWLTSRQFERKLKETQGEATQLRNMLTMIEKNATNHSTDDLKQSISESNGDPSSPPPRFLPPPPTSPPFMMFQPPPPPHPHHDYIPPPPLVYPEVAAAAARPPTLGRISSPPLDHPRFSPPPPPHHMPPPPYLFDPSPPYSPPSATGVHHHHSPSPPPPHRPLPKPHMSADQKESISPGYSEHHERPNRRSKR